MMKIKALLLVIFIISIFAVNSHSSKGLFAADYSEKESMDSIIFQESFEGTFPPAGWTFQTVGAGWVESTSYIHSGVKSAVHMDDQGAQNDWLVTPLVSIPADSSSTLSFWQAVYYGNYMNGINEVGISTDGGTTFTSIWSENPAAVATMIDGEYYYVSETLIDYLGQDINIGFHYTGDYGCQWYIDDIEILHDFGPPTIISILANEVFSPIIGEYLNNDMVINLDIYDVSGVSTVMGHYSFDSGATVNDLSFSMVEGDVWSGVIPAMSEVASGTIYFDLTDINGVSGTSSIYNIEFKNDAINPVINYVSGTEGYLNDPLYINLLFEDESTIQSCTGHYSKDGWITQYDFTLNPSKINEYFYIGIIPAESSEVFDGEVTFTIVDQQNNTLESTVYLVNWRNGQLEFVEDFESGLGNWTTTGNWAIVEEGEYTSPIHALTESPGGDYSGNESSEITLTNSLDWSAYISAEMSFWCKYDIELDYDHMYFDVTDDNGASWTNLKVWDGLNPQWHEEKFLLDSYVGSSEFNFRFRFASDANVVMNGMYIDDIKIVSYNIDADPPVIDYSLYDPAFHEGDFEEFTNFVNVDDVTGVNAVKIIYSVDGVPKSDIAATLVLGNQWEFTIPTQQAGAIIDYTFWAQDTYSTPNADTLGTVYTIIAGKHKIYDSGTVSYYDTTDTGNAKAVRISSSEFSTQQVDLAYLLIRNYAETGLLSDSMTVRVWEDDNGVPGTELISSIVVIPEANNLVNTSAMTMIDLRSLTLTITGDYWIGFSSDHGSVYSTREATNETATTDYARSFDGAYNGDGTWTWAIHSENNYHFRAVVGGEYALNTPTNVSVGAAGTTLTIDWDIMPDATSYMIYGADDPYETFTLLSTVNGSTNNTWNTQIDTATKMFYYVISTNAVKDMPEVSTIKQIQIHSIK